MMSWRHLLKTGRPLMNVDNLWHPSWQNSFSSNSQREKADGALIDRWPLAHSGHDRRIQRRNGSALTPLCVETWCRRLDLSCRGYAQRFLLWWRKKTLSPHCWFFEFFGEPMGLNFVDSIFSRLHWQPFLHLVATVAVVEAWVSTS